MNASAERVSADSERALHSWKALFYFLFSSSCPPNVLAPATSGGPSSTPTPGPAAPAPAAPPPGYRGGDRRWGCAGRVGDIDKESAREVACRSPDNRPESTA